MPCGRVRTRATPPSERTLAWRRSACQLDQLSSAPSAIQDRSLNCRMRRQHSTLHHLLRGPPVRNVTRSVGRSVGVPADWLITAPAAVAPAAVPPLPLLLLTFPSCFCITEPSVSQSQTDTRIIIYTSAGRHGSAGCRASVTVPLMAIERLSFSHSAHLHFAENSLPLPFRLSPSFSPFRRP